MIVSTTTGHENPIRNWSSSWSNNNMSDSFSYLVTQDEWSLHCYSSFDYRSQFCLSFFMRVSVFKTATLTAGSCSLTGSRPLRDMASSENDVDNSIGNENMVLRLRQSSSCVNCRNTLTMIPLSLLLYFWFCRLWNSVCETQASCLKAGLTNS